MHTESSTVQACGLRAHVDNSNYAKSGSHEVHTSLSAPRVGVGECKPALS